MQRKFHRSQDEVYTIHMVSHVGSFTTVCTIGREGEGRERVLCDHVQKIKGPVFVFLSFLIAAIDRTRTRHREVSPRTSERGSRVRAGCSPPLNFVASSRTLHPIRSMRRGAPRSSEAIIVIIIVTSSASMDAHGAITRKGTEVIRLPHPCRQVLKS